MQAIAFEEVLRIREQVARANALAAERFRHAFAAQSDIPPNERWRVHLEIQAAALLESSRGVSTDRGAVHYDILGQTVVPYVVRGEPLFPHFRIERTPEALFEYWMLVSELLGTASWRMTSVVASHDEYDAALRRMSQPQIVRALVGSFLPSADWRDDGSALLEVALYTRAGEERIERRLLALDAQNEFHFHSRELIAEGRGGVAL
jgi:hypothetical protein